MQVLHLPNRDHRNDGVTTLKCASTHVPRFLTGSDPPISDRQLPFGCSIAQAVTTAHRRAAARNSFLGCPACLIHNPAPVRYWAIVRRGDYAGQWRGSDRFPLGRAGPWRSKVALVSSFDLNGYWGFGPV